MKSPFKFLDSYTREDSEIFFSRDQKLIVQSKICRLTFSYVQ
jgi:hypothetical protein